MFANSQMAGIDNAFPDPCRTPPVGVPLPYPNMAFGNMGVPAAYTVLILGAPAHTLATTVPVTFLDEPGVMGGFVSQIFKGPSRHTTCAATVLFQGQPATRMGSATLQNLTNCTGARLVPSQTKVLIQAP
jgi:hypothetical protein